MIEQTIQLMEENNWVLVLLGERSKRPVGSSWQTTVDPETVRRHKGNLGLVCGDESGVAVLDFDDMDAARAMMEELGPLPITVQTGSGKWHCYVRWEPDLPPKLLWNGETIGEIQRGPRQQVVIPPSVHPSGGSYCWGRVLKVPELPAPWRSSILRPPLDPRYALPRHIMEGEPWTGPAPSELLDRAAQQPGARRRANGIKFQCPACRNEGHDRHRDNALIGNDGRWGCAYAPGDSVHKRAIGEALGAFDQIQQLADEQVSDQTVNNIMKRLGLAREEA